MSTSSKLLVDIDQDGLQEWAYFNADGELLALEHRDDSEAIVEQNKRLQNDGNKGYGKTREWRHIAAIPPILLLKWANEKGVTAQFIQSREGFNDIVMKMIRDPDYRFLRIDI